MDFRTLGFVKFVVYSDYDCTLALKQQFNLLCIL